MCQRCTTPLLERRHEPTNIGKLQNEPGLDGMRMSLIIPRHQDVTPFTYLWHAHATMAWPEPSFTRTNQLHREDKSATGVPLQLLEDLP